MSGSTEREKRREQRLHEETEVERVTRRKRLTQLVSGAMFLAIVAVAVAIVVSQSQSSGGNTNLEDVGLVQKQLNGIPQEGAVLGYPKAKVTLIEFGDLQCPVCKAYSEQVIPQLISGPVKSGKARIDFHNYTIIGPQSTPAGAAALAAGEQGRGWNYIELFYRNQGPEDSGYATDSFLKAIAKGAGVKNLAKWNADRRSKRILKQVSNTTGEAERLGFTGTPSFAVLGPGTKGIETLETPGSAGALEEAIEKAG
ncbi:MAG TPA: thioredoxin domain-containing protein [Solirubrobacterales bacterium]|jgi:protein-disulfide isomerase|nr:thioredoxin domain-containing protein [Solirubrobacterales bacterium]